MGGPGSGRWPKVLHLIREFVRPLFSEDEARAAAVFLLAVVHLGLDVDDNRVAAWARLDVSDCVRWRATAYKQGIFRPDGKIHCEWLDERHGTIAFVLDVSVLLGQVTRVPIPKQKPILKPDGCLYDEITRNSEWRSRLVP